MSAIPSILTDLERCGVRIVPEENNLRLKGPHGTLTPDLLGRVTSAKPEILAILTAPALGSEGLTIPLDNGIAHAIDGWPEADRERFHERAAIREFDGGMDRLKAERAGFGDLRAKVAKI